MPSADRSRKTAKPASPTEATAEFPGEWGEVPPATPGAASTPERTLGDWLQDIVPPEAQMHFLNAGREFAAGVSVTLEHHLGEKATPAADDRPVRIEIE
ncbi:MAG: hypothetical protein ACYDGR_12980 [Candidatus Dormibacteria bacterium]